AARGYIEAGDLPQPDPSRRQTDRNAGAVRFRSVRSSGRRQLESADLRVHLRKTEGFFAEIPPPDGSRGPGSAVWDSPESPGFGRLVRIRGFQAGGGRRRQVRRLPSLRTFALALLPLLASLATLAGAPEPQSRVEDIDAARAYTVSYGKLATLAKQ